MAVAQMHMELSLNMVTGGGRSRSQSMVSNSSGLDDFLGHLMGGGSSTASTPRDRAFSWDVLADDAVVDPEALQAIFQAVPGARARADSFGLVSIGSGRPRAFSTTLGADDVFGDDGASPKGKRRASLSIGSIGGLCPLSPLGTKRFKGLVGIAGLQEEDIEVRLPSPWPCHWRGRWST